MKPNHHPHSFVDSPAPKLQACDLKEETDGLFFDLIVVTGSRNYLGKAGGSAGMYIIQSFFVFLLFHTLQVPIPCISILELQHFGINLCLF